MCVYVVPEKGEERRSVLVSLLVFFSAPGDGHRKQVEVISIGNAVKF